MMYRKTVLALMVCTVLLFVACGQSGKQTDVFDDGQPVGMVATNEDTTKVLNLVNEFLGHLKNNQIDSAMAMLHSFDFDSYSVIDVPADIAKNQRMALSAFRPVDYELDHLIFQTETDCEVKYSAILFHKEPGDNRPNKMSYVLKPIRIDGQWYLTLADRADAITKDSAIPN